MLKDHQPVFINSFNGLWSRGDVDNTPLDHFADSINIQFRGNNSFSSRDGIGLSQSVELPITNIRRIYNYPTQTASTLIVLTYDGTTGRIYHVVSAGAVYGPVLSLAGMTDFAFVPYAGRAYISPFTTYSGIIKGLQSEFIYVYAGDGTAARKAGGTALSGTPTIANGAAGHTDAGFKLFAFVAETSSGALLQPSGGTGFKTANAFSVSFGSVPTGAVSVTKRYLVATKTIPHYNNDPTAYQYFFVPGGTINNNTDTFLNDVSFFDADLVDDASYLFDNYSNIPAGAVLTLYRNRLIVGCTYTDISSLWGSAVGDPEAISQVDGVIVVPPDGNPLTQAQELRDVLYVMKNTRTVAFADNGDEPSSWPMVVVDNALGCPVHGIATVIDSGATTVDYLIVATYQGITMFNGRYITPELSFKVEMYWRALSRAQFGAIQLINSPIEKMLYIVLPNGYVLTGNYQNGMDPKSIRWSPWSFPVTINTVAVWNIDQIILGASEIAVDIPPLLL